MPSWLSNFELAFCGLGFSGWYGIDIYYIMFLSQSRYCLYPKYYNEEIKLIYSNSPPARIDLVRFFLSFLYE